MSDNLYNVLGLSDNATKDEIKKAYRSLQMKWHPDKNNGSEESMKMSKSINEAYETLGDDQKRAEYDHNLKNPNPFMRMNSNNGMDVPMDDIFNMFFGMGGNPFGMPGGFPPGANIHIFHGGPGGPMGFQQAISKPQPIMKTISITMEQVLTGATVPLDIERWIVENGIKVNEKETIYLTVPPGIDDNEILIVRDKGNVLNENIKGDIKIFVKINNTTVFKRAGLDLVFEKNISLKEALCGFTFEIQYVNGKSYTLNNKGTVIPPEYKKVYPKMGLIRDGHQGNMVIHFHVDFPEKLSDTQIAQLSEVL